LVPNGNLKASEKLDKNQSSWKAGRRYRKECCQHSRLVLEVKVATDINELLDEIFTAILSGLRAKDKSFQMRFLKAYLEGRNFSFDLFDFPRYVGVFFEPP